MSKNGGNSVRFFAVLLAIVFLSVCGARAAESPWDSYRIYLRGLLAERAGKMVPAMEAYQEVLRRDPGAVFLYEALADVAMNAGRGDVALSAARQSVALSTGNAGAYLLLGRVHLARGENREAQAAFDQALTLDPSNVEILGWAASRRQLADPQGARSMYEKFLSANPEAEGIRGGLAEIQKRQGDLQAAEESYKKILASDPSNADAQLGLAGLFDVRGDTPSAISGYEAYLQINPDALDVLVRLGQLYFILGRWPEARVPLDHALEIDGENRAVHFWRALVAQEEGQWDLAVHHMEFASQGKPEPGLLLRLASYYSHQGNTKKTIQTLSRLQKSQPTNPDFMYFMALAYEDLNQPRSAIRWLDRALALAPDQPDLHFHLALNWDKRGHFDQVEKHLLRTIDVDPKNALALNFLGYSWADRNVKGPEALALIQRAVALEPHNPAYRDSLGWAFYRLGRFAEAEEALGSVVDVANDPLVWSHYGDVLKALGREPEAVRAWQEGLLLSPNDKELLKRLGEDGRPRKVMPVSAPRTLLKRVEGNYRQLASLSGVAAVTVRSSGKTVSGRGLFYYTRPGLFRIEVLGPFLVPQAVLTYNGTAHWTPAVATTGEEGPWLSLWAEVLSGDFFKRFDSPSVRVQQEGTTLVYTALNGELRLDAQTKAVVEVKKGAPGETAVFLKFGASREEAGVVLPSVVEGDAPAGGFGFSLQFSRLTVNPPLKSALFDPAP